MATQSSILAWRIPWTEEPGGLPSTGPQRAEQDCSDLAAPTHREGAQHLLMSVTGAVSKSGCACTAAAAECDGPASQMCVWKIHVESLLEVQIFRIAFIIFFKN